MATWRCVLAVLAVLAILSPPASADDDAQPANGRAVREANAAGFRFLVFETADAKSDATLPMILGLHYSGATPEAMLAYFDDIDFPARVVLPQGAYPRRGGYSWFASDYAGLDEARQAAKTFEVEQALSTFIESTLARHPTRGKPVVMGISYGGDLALLLALRHPRQLRAAFPVAARFLPVWMSSGNVCGSVACAPIRAMHGDQDTTVPMAPTREAMEHLRGLGFDAELQPYRGVAHDFDARMQRDFARRAKHLLAPEPGVGGDRRPLPTCITRS